MGLLATFLTVLFTVFLAEFGDKTQLLLIGMTSKYKIRDIVAGTAVAIAILNALAVFIGGVLNEILKEYLWAVKYVAAAAFIYFSVSSLKKDDDDEESGESKIRFAPVAVMVTFFIAELGDKTQLAAVTFGASYGLGQSLVIWAACTIGLFAADIIGMLIGCFLKAKAPEVILKAVSFLLFAGFGFFTIYQASNFLQEFLASKGSSVSVPVIPVMAAAGVVFLLLCGLMVRHNKRLP